MLQESMGHLPRKGEVRALVAKKSKSVDARNECSDGRLVERFPPPPRDGLTVPFPAFPEATPEPPTYHFVKQLSSDAAAPLRLLKLSSVSKLIPRRQLFPDAPGSAAREREKRGGGFDLVISRRQGRLHWLPHSAQQLKQTLSEKYYPLYFQSLSPHTHPSQRGGEERRSLAYCCQHLTQKPRETRH